MSIHSLEYDSLDPADQSCFCERKFAALKVGRGEARNREEREDIEGKLLTHELLPS